MNTIFISRTGSSQPDQSGKLQMRTNVSRPTQEQIDAAIAEKQAATRIALATLEQEIHMQKTVLAELDTVAKLEVGDRLLVRRRSNYKYGVLDRSQGEVVRVLSVELTDNCMTGVRIHFTGPKGEGSGDLSWFEAVRVVGESEVAK